MPNIDVSSTWTQNDDETVTISGWTAANVTVTIQVDNDTPVTTTSDEFGDYSVDVPMTTGPHRVSASGDGRGISLRADVEEGGQQGAAAGDRQMRGRPILQVAGRFKILVDGNVA